MAKPLPVAQVAWRFENAPGSDMVVAVCRDSVTQRDYRFEVPLHTLPSLAGGIDDLIDAHPEDFPAIIAYRFT